MGIRQSNKLLVILSSFWMFLVLVIGAWWLYLILKLDEKLSLLYQLRPEMERGPDMVKLAMWEGGTFFILLTLLSATMFILFVRDQQKTKSIQAFFASLTHELKTPLASMQLQAEVLSDTVKDSSNTEQSRIETLTARLTQDSKRLEDELDKILQLSRVELGGNLNPSPINLRPFIQNQYQDFSPSLKLEISGEETWVLADEFALTIILRNLFDNSIKHASNPSPKDKLKATINLTKIKDQVEIHYRDNGSHFSGNISKLGKLFYKHKSSKGSGIGLYLTEKLLRGMNGSFRITNHSGLNFYLSLPQNSNKGMV